MLHESGRPGVVRTPAPLVTLTRAQITNGRLALGKAPGLDTTVKSSRGLGRAFAPTWDMVLSHKRGVLSDAGYTEAYLCILDAVPLKTWRALYALGLEQGGAVTVTCYCRDSAPFCHTHILLQEAVQRYPRAFTREASPRVEDNEHAR